MTHSSTDENIRKIFLFELISNAALLILSLIATLIPIVKIGSSSLGNAWQVLARIDTLMSMKEASLANAIGENAILILPAVISVAALITTVVDLLIAVVCRNNERYHYANRSSLAPCIFMLALGAICVVFLIVASGDFAHLYSTKRHISFFAAALIVLKLCLSPIVVSLMTKHNPDKIKESRQYKRAGGNIIAMRIPKAVAMIVVIWSTLYMVESSLAVRGMASPKKLMTNGLYMLDISTPQSAANAYEFYNDDNSYELVQSFLNGEQGSPTVERSYSLNYAFYNSFIERTEDKINAMFPEDFSEEAFKAYTEACVQLRKDIEIAEELRDQHYFYSENIHYSRGESYNIGKRIRLDMNAGTSGGGIKWESREDSLDYVDGESIVLSKTKFSTSTDFSKIQLVAHITYADGSKQYTVITIDNVTELNAAEPGTHALRFHDDWGSYGVAITIN